MPEQGAAYRLVRRSCAAAAPPRLDDAQQAVVSHRGGPLLVLAGPGTGKSTTIVEAVVERIAHRGIDPRRVLVLTFSRKAAHELRERITARLRRTTREPLALTFHSYAYALVRREFTAAGDEPPRLLSGPEQLLEIRQMLRGEAHDGAGLWPPQLRSALATRGFAEELRDLLLRAAERGLDGPGLAKLGRRRKREDWIAAGGFAERYAARFDLAPVPAYDYAQIIRIAAAMLTRTAVRARERDAYDAVLVDEYQDTDPAQEALLHALASGGRELIVVGDPDQSIYGFRGTDLRVILGFPDRFRTADGRPAPVVALHASRRSGTFLLAASRRVARRLPVPVPRYGPGHRVLRSAQETPEPGEASVIIADSASQEAAVVADTLRRAHLADGVPWSRMAILVRSARLQVPLLRRALLAAGVPVTVAGDEVPLVGEPAVRPLLLLLRCALYPRTIDGESAAELLTGPLGGADSLAMRRLRRELHAIAADTQGEQPGPPPDVLAAALHDSRVLILVPAGIRQPAERVAGMIATARQVIADGGSAEDVLWGVWDASGLASRWRADSAAGGAKGAAADRDLDAVLALFDAAARHTERLPPGAPAEFLASLTGQEIPGDTLAEQAAADDAVRVLTAHRSKGLEWDVVVVAGVQEGIWPDLRTRGSLLGLDEFVEAAAGSQLAGEAAAVSTMYKLLAEERRLFYVAVTRARQRLVVTAVGGDDTEARPSRFLPELAGDDISIERVAGAQPRWLSLPALVASLRSAAADRTRPPQVRLAAAAKLARLARAGVRGAHPSQWYALTTLSDGSPVTGRTVRLSPSQADSFTKCGLRWLLEVAASARAPDVARRLGTVVHAAAAAAAAGAGDAEIEQGIDEAWQFLDFPAAWYASKRRDEANRMVRRFLDWHRDNPRKLVASEEPFRIQLGRVEIIGRVDRLEADDGGRAVVVDLKTGTSRPSDDELDRHPQLGVYQLAVLLGAFERFGLTEPGGAELVHVGKAALAATARVQRQRELTADPDPGWPRALVEAVAEGMAGPVFNATVNPGCRVCPVASCCPAHERGAHVTP